MNGLIAENAEGLAQERTKINSVTSARFSVTSVVIILRIYGVKS